MLVVFLGFGAIALILNSANSAHLFPRQEALLRIDHDPFLSESSPYSLSPVWPKPDAEIQCSAKNMTLKISRLGSAPLHVTQNDSWLMVYQTPPQCSPTTSRHRRSLWPPPHGCDFLHPSGPGTFPVRVAGTPLVVGCPYPPRSPTVECTDGLQLRIGGVHAMSLKIKVMGHWYPLMTVCRWCQLTVELKGGEVSIKAPFKGPCTETKGGVYSLSLSSGDAEITFSCTPPPWPFPHPGPFRPFPHPGPFPPFPHPGPFPPFPHPGPFPPFPHPGPFPPFPHPGPFPPFPHPGPFPPFPHPGPFPPFPHPGPFPPFPWPIHPPPPKPLHPWHTIPYHAHPAPNPWQGILPSWLGKVQTQEVPQLAYVTPDGTKGDGQQQQALVIGMSR